MRRILPVLIFMLISTTALAQWRHDAGDTTGNGLGSNFAFGVHNGILFSSDANGVWRHYDTGMHPWVAVDNGIDFTQGKVTSFASLGRYLFAGMTTSIGDPSTAYRSMDNGSHWIPNAGGNVCSNGSYVFCVSDVMYQSKDSGNTNTWQKITTFPADNYAAIGGCILAMTNSGIWRSIDSGNINSWTQTQTPSGISLYAFAVIGTEMFAGESAVFRSTDSGQGWTRVATPPLGYTQYPYKLPGAVNALASYGTYLFAGTDTGVFVSSDSGGSWRNVSQGLGGGNRTWTLGFPAVKLLAVVDTMLFAGVYTGTDASGNLYGYDAKRPIPEMTPPPSAVQQIAQPGDTIEVYPNPASGLVTIRVGGSYGAILQVSVLNVLGVNMLDLPNLREADITLDISKLPSGTYFLRIETANGSVLRKVIRE